MEAHPTYADADSVSSISVFPAVFSTSNALVAVESTIHMFRRKPTENSPLSLSPQMTDLPSASCQSLSEFASKTRSILSDVQILEKQLHLERQRSAQSQRRRRRIKRSRSHEPHPSTPLVTPTKHAKHRSFPCEASHGGRRMSSEFASFCERLVLVNKIWEQERQLKALRADLESRKKEKEATAFKSFCDQLVHWNKIWRLEKEIKTLVEEGNRLKRGRVVAVTRAAKKMVLDVQKERLVEEFVKDLIHETAETKREAEELKSAHEEEVKEIHNEWLKDYRRVTRELEVLKLAQEAKLIEQQVANSVEDTLYDTLQKQKQRIDALEAEVAEYAKTADQTLVADSSAMQDFHDDDPTDVEQDILSELSTSSTCVSTEASGRRSVKTFQRVTVAKPSLCVRCTRRSGEPIKSSLLFTTTEPLDDPSTSRTGSPLMMNTKLSTLMRSCDHSGRPLAIRNRTVSALSSRVPSPLVRCSCSENRPPGPVIKPRAPWR